MAAEVCVDHMLLDVELSGQIVSVVRTVVVITGSSGDNGDKVGTAAGGGRGMMEVPLFAHVPPGI